jgi:ADP-heptose:LPS heptosyltransferase
MTRHALVVRLDSQGDVLLAGPAVRAVAVGARKVTLLCGPRGMAAAELLPDVDELVCFRAPWIDPEPGPVEPAEVEALVSDLSGREIEQALILTSFHQSPLPTALLLRLAGIPEVAAISEDYPGSLLDVRHRVSDDLHEVERALSLVGTLGYRLPSGDDGRLAVRVSPGTSSAGPYVVVHPGASVPSRAPSPAWTARLVGALAAAGRRVLVTGASSERALTGRVAEAEGTDLGGKTTFAELAAVLAGADCLVAGNTGPAHLAAAVGTPVVSLFAPVVPALRWRPWGVPHVLLGDQHAACRDSRARTCPVAGHPCLDGIPHAAVVAALDELAPARSEAAA